MLAGAAGAVILLAGGCVGPAPRQPATASATKALAARPGPGPSRRVVPTPGRAAAPRWPTFSAVVSGLLTRRDVPFSLRPGCPVPPGELRAIHPSYAGFDRRAHTGEIVVNAAVVRQVIKVFRILYRARFPIRRMDPVDVFHGSDARSMAADNTSGFNCRYADGPGPPQWSMHAYGLAIDVNSVQNPHLEPGLPPSPGRRRLRQPVRSPPGDGLPRGHPGCGIQLHRLGMGRLLGGFPRLPALLCQRPLAAPPGHRPPEYGAQRSLEVVAAMGPKSLRSRLRPGSWTIPVPAGPRKVVGSTALPGLRVRRGHRLPEGTGGPPVRMSGQAGAGRWSRAARS
jgi:hypothetical protein